MSKYGLRGTIVVLCFLSMMHTVGGVEDEKDAFSFEYTFELSEDRTCHVTVVETITFNDHYIGNLKYLAEFEGDKIDADGGGGGGGFYWGDPGPGSGGQQYQTGGGKYPLIEYIRYMEWTKYNPQNFKATDYKTGDRLNVSVWLSGDYKDFIIDIKKYIGAPEKGDTYTFVIEYDTENRAEVIGDGRYAFSFYRKGSSQGGLYQYSVSITLPPHYEYEKSKISDPSHVSSSGTYAKVRYQGEYTKDGIFEFRLEYHYPVSIFVEEGKSLLEKGDYSGAQKKFEEAKKRYQNLGKQSELAAVNTLISQCREMETAYKLFESAKTRFLNREFAAAQQQFEEVVSQYGVLLDEDTIRECNNYIEICSKYVRAQELEQQAEADIQAELWETALSNLQEAKDIYSELGENDKVSWIEERIEQIQQEWKEQSLQGQFKMFAIGSVAVIGGLIFVFFGYNTLKRTAKPGEMIDVGELLESPDVPEEVKKFLEEKVGWRKVQKRTSRTEDVEIMEKLKKGRETLQKMMKEGLISEKEYYIALGDIDKKIGHLVNQGNEP